jgi:hypothetical protein
MKQNLEFLKQNLEKMQKSEVRLFQKKNRTPNNCNELSLHKKVKSDSFKKKTPPPPKLQGSQPSLENVRFFEKRNKTPPKITSGSAFEEKGS